MMKLQAVMATIEMSHKSVYSSSYIWVGDLTYIMAEISQMQHVLYIVLPLTCTSWQSSQT